MTPELFFSLLFECGFSTIIQAPFGNSRTQLMRGLMGHVQRKIFEVVKAPTGKDTAKKTNHITCIGQTHDDRDDRAIAISYASEMCGQKGPLILEADGVLHPRLDPKGILHAAHESGRTIILEHQLYGNFARPPIDTLERSWLLGMYIANMIYYQSPIDITLIVGENHINDIRYTVEIILGQMDYCDKIVWQRVRSANSRYEPSAISPELSVDLLKESFIKFQSEFEKLNDSLKKLAQTSTDPSPKTFTKKTASQANNSHANQTHSFFKESNIHEKNSVTIEILINKLDKLNRDIVIKYIQDCAKDFNLDDTKIMALLVPMSETIASQSPQTLMELIYETLNTQYESMKELIDSGQPLP